MKGKLEFTGWEIEKFNIDNVKAIQFIYSEKTLSTVQVTMQVPVYEGHCPETDFLKEKGFIALFHNHSRTAVSPLICGDVSLVSEHPSNDNADTVDVTFSATSLNNIFTYNQE